MMTKSERDAVLLYLISVLHTIGSWCGRTHIQKVTYFLQELLGVPLGFDFILYKHGPYSFDLSDNITALRADAFLQYESKDPYGPSIVITQEAQNYLKRFPKTLLNYEKNINFIAQKLGKMNVAELERLATALYIILNYSVSVPDDKLEQLVIQLKPHITIDEASLAIKVANKIISEAEELFMGV